DDLGTYAAADGSQSTGAYAASCPTLLEGAATTQLGMVFIGHRSDLKGHNPNPSGADSAALATFHAACGQPSTADRLGMFYHELSDYSGYPLSGFQTVSAPLIAAAVKQFELVK
ncbi:MAG: hypothetical protein KDD44_07260, partial [Bdellovibrionales bacterium]|nr:hypothetical protein [Bdellovibrionales bacterium]